MTPRRLALLLHTTRYLAPAQIARRARLMARRGWWRWTNARAPMVYGHARRAAFAPLWQLPSDPSRDVLEGRFTFVGETRVHPAWNEPSASQLWRYHLQYFDYLRDLAALGAYGPFRELVRSWIAASTRLRGDAWHPYPVSLRIVNWCDAGAFFARELANDPDFEREFHASLYGQAQFVAANLETDVRGNHLLKNLGALLWAGSYFGVEAWTALALRVLRIEVAEQVLPDGAHFERVPAYHVQVLGDLAGCAELLRSDGNAQAWLEEAVERMEVYLHAITPPDGRLPLFKDTTHPAPHVGLPSGRPFHGSLAGAGETPASWSAERRPHLVSPPLGGYFLSRDDARGEFLIADYGPPCPDYLPAHAHADMFSFELTAGGGPLVVDSGVYEYAAGQWRDWFRSTAAHNTVEVQGENQSEVWSSFRVARRATPHNVEVLEQDGIRIIRGEHDGYTRLRPSVIHRRTIIAARAAWIVVDELLGHGETRATSRIHLHPDRSIAELNLTVFGAKYGVERGWYSERFGEKRENDVVTLDVTGAMPLIFGYCVAWPVAAAALFRREGDDTVVTLTTALDRVTVVLPCHGAVRIA